MTDNRTLVYVPSAHSPLVMDIEWQRDIDKILGDSYLQAYGEADI